MKSFLFRVRFAFKNIITNPGRSFVILFTLFLSMTVFVVVFCIQHAFSQFYYYRVQEQYLNVDITLTFDSNSDARIINQRHMVEEYSEYYEDIACFFNYYSLTSTTSESAEVTFYTKVLSASVSELEMVLDTELGDLENHQAMVTSSLAKKRDLSVGDQLDIYVSDQKVTYTIGAVINDRGIFEDDAIFVDKVELLYELYGLTPLTNLGNIIYLDLKDEVSVDEFLLMMQNDSIYQDYVVSKTINQQIIDQNALQVSAMYIGVGLITLLALFLVLDSIFPLLFNDFRAQIGVIRTLGGDHRFSLSIWWLQFFMYGLVAIPLGVLTAAILLNKGMQIAGIRTAISLGTWQVPTAVIGFMLILGMEILIRYYHLSKQSSVTLSSDKRPEQIRLGWITVPASGLILLITVLFHPLDEKMNAAIEFAFGLLLCFSLISFTLDLCGRLVARGKKPSLFSLLGAKNLKSMRIIHNSLKVAMVSVLVIVLTLTMRSFMYDEVNKASENIVADFFLTNIVDYSEDLKAEIVQEPGVVSVDQSITYTGVMMNYSKNGVSDQRKISFLISLPYAKMSTYFGFAFEGDLESKFESTTIPYIAIPYTTAKILNMEIGDQVKIAVSRQIPELTFTIAGFINTNYTGMAFTNLCNLSEYNTDEYYNTLMIKTAESAGETVKNTMMKAYNARMYYVVDTNDTVKDSSEEMLAVTNYLSFLALAIAFAFIIVIINNSLLVFYSLRPIYAKMKVMGLSLRELQKEISIEIGLMVLILFLSSSLCLIVLIPNLGPLMLFLHYYKMIQIPASAIVGRVLLGSAVFVFSFVFYFFKASSINVIQEIKKY